MAVSARMLREAVAVRIRAKAPELVQASMPLGIAAQSQPGLTRGFFVRFGNDGGAGDRVRPGTLIRIRQSFAIELGHSIRALAKDGDGASVWDLALDDREAVRWALCNHNSDALAEADGSLEYLGCSTEVIGGGAYLITTLSWAVTYPQDLA
jgi:hypothetical protein